MTMKYDDWSERPLYTLELGQSSLFEEIFPTGQGILTEEQKARLQNPVRVNVMNPLEGQMLSDVSVSIGIRLTNFDLTSNEPIRVETPYLTEGLRAEIERKYNRLGWNVNYDFNDDTKKVGVTLTRKITGEKK